MTDIACDVLIAGAGPSGLAAALLLDQLGWKNIVVAERRPADAGLDRGRAFNYQLDGRGQRVLEDLGVDTETLTRFGLPNDHFTLTTFAPDGTATTRQPPILVPGRKTPYWMTRTKLMELLHERVAARSTTSAIRLLFGHRFAGFIETDDGFAATIETDGAGPIQLVPRLVLGCDGLNSQVRQGLVELGSPQAVRMQRTVQPSPSAKLKYKVLNLPATFPANGGRDSVADHSRAFAFTSTFRDPAKRMALFALPVAGPADPRTINIILPDEHSFWTLSDAPSVREYLEAAFPQIDVAAIAGESEFAAFVATEPAGFPEPQYTRHVHAALPCARVEGDMQCLLVGDAAHAFPPDLGMGVNSAFEDVAELAPFVAKPTEPLDLASYAALREPEHAALVRLVQRVHPYQYNQVPWRLKLWTVRFLVQFLLYRASAGFVEMPGFMLSQRHRMPFTEMERRYRAGNRALSVLGIAVAALVGLWVFA